MLKMKRNFANTASILSIISILITLLGIGVMLFAQLRYSVLSSGSMIANLLPSVVQLVAIILLCVCCFRRDLGVLPGVTMGLFSLYYLYTVVRDIIILIGGTSPTPLLTALYAICYLAEAVLYALLLLTCVTGGQKKFSFVPKCFIATTVLGGILLAIGNVPAGEGLDDAIPYLLIGLFSAAFASIPDLAIIFTARAINGAMADHVPAPYYGAYPDRNADFYRQAPQYQAPQYQQPQYQAPQYQAPQYQAPQYQAPQYQPPAPPQGRYPVFYYQPEEKHPQSQNQ